MRVLGLDFEATGLDTKEARIIEFGAVLWDTDSCCPLASASGFVAPVSKPLTNYLSEEIKKVTGICDSYLNEFGQSFDSMYQQIKNLSLTAEYIIAHNGNKYDRPLFTSECSREGVENLDKNWIDTLEDIEYPESCTTRKLSYLATEHGFINPFPHRALYDVLTMLKIFSMYNATEVALNSRIATVEVRAKVSYDDRELAQKRGYRWDKDRKWWVKNLKQNKLISEVERCPFPVEET